MNLLELIELRAKNWHVSDGLNTYYKHKVSDVQVIKRSTNIYLIRLHKMEFVFSLIA